MTNGDLTQVMDRLKNLEKRFVNLEKAILGGTKIKKRIKLNQPTSTSDVDFSFNKKAFVKRYASDKSGPKKFTLLLAFLVRGSVDKEIEIGEILKHWSKMSAKNLLGKFNYFYPNNAQTQGWIDSKKRGSYNLMKEWKNVL